MLDLLLIPLMIAYVGIVLTLLVFGLNFSYLTWASFRNRNSKPASQIPTDLPAVTVQIPIFNERYVAERVIMAAAEIRYPRDRFQIQVLDDSTDDTTKIIAGCIGALTQARIDVDHVRRFNRHGYKAGALGNGLQTATGEYLAIFDADFIPGPDFLERTVPVLCNDHRLAFVQGRWGHLNREQSMLTRIQAMSIDGHFRIEQQARWAHDHCFNFNGTAGVWRREAIVDAGGWSHRTLTEDLDLSYRTFLQGWRAAYINDLEVKAELPVSFMAYRRQQHRWAHGSFRCAGRLVPLIWRSNFRLRSKIEATLHLGGYVIHLLLLGLVGIFPAIILVSRSYPTLLPLFGTMAILNVAALAPSAMFLFAQHLTGRRWYLAAPTVAVLTLVGVGMMMNTARAAIGAIGGRPGVFTRTPKFGAKGAGPRWRGLAYQGRLDKIVFFEATTVILCAWTAREAARSGSWAIATYASIFGAGLMLNASLTIWQVVAIVLRQRQNDRRKRENADFESLVATGRNQNVHDDDLRSTDGSGPAGTLPS